MFLIYIVIAFAAGVALASQAAVNAQLAKAMSGEPIIAALVSFCVGSVALLIIAWLKTDLWGNLANLPSQPWWKLIGGLMGALFVFTTVLLAPKLGITTMLFFVIIGQLVAASVIDHFGLIGMPLREMSGAKLIGLFVVACGLLFYFFGEKFIQIVVRG